MRIEGYGDVRVLQRRAYDHSRGVYYAVVELPGGREAVVTSPHGTGPYRVTAPYEVRPPSRIEGQ